MHILAAALLAIQSPDSTLIREFTEVLRAAPIERVDAAAAATAVRGVLVDDLDADGRAEAVVWIEPRLRQTPTVLLFSRAADGSWVRIAEGLVPGRLVRVSGRFTDTHTLGLAADLTAGDGSRDMIERMLGAGAASGMSFVAYRGFLHADNRQNATFIVDLQDWALPPGVEKTCESYEFSSVQSMRIGRLAGGGASRFLVALTEDDVTVYRITSISPSGRLAATSVVRTRERSVRGLTQLADGSVALETNSGTRPIAAP